MKCDKCNKRATYNIQNVYKLYKIKYDKKGIEKYTIIDEWIGDEVNEFYCDEHLPV